MSLGQRSVCQPLDKNSCPGANALEQQFFSWGWKTERCPHTHLILVKKCYIYFIIPNVPFLQQISPPWDIAISILQFFVFWNWWLMQFVKLKDLIMLYYLKYYYFIDNTLYSPIQIRDLFTKSWIRPFSNFVKASAN